MHYYKRNLGDYAKKAGRLSILQHGAYTLLMDACYDREQFPTKEEAIEWVWASSTAEVEAVEFVLSKFFVLKDGVYVQNRIQEELDDYRSKAETNKRIAIDRETKRRENNTNRAKASPDKHEPPPNQEPITNNQEPNTSEPKGSGEKPPKVTDPDEIIFGYGVPLLTNSGTAEKQARSFLGGLRKHHGDDALIGKLRECMKAKPLQPLEWLAAALPPKSSGASRHTGFEKINYREGVTADGRF